MDERDVDPSPPTIVQARQPFNFTGQSILPPQTSLEQKIFDKIWNLQLGWNWMETDQKKLFFDSKGNHIKEKKLFKAYFDKFGRTSPWGDFLREAMAIYYFMKEPIR